MLRAAAVRALALAIVAGLLTAPALAHDFWIEPGSFAPLPGEAVAVRLRVGEHFDGEPVPRPSALQRFVVAELRSGASAALPGRQGADPAGWLRLPRHGGYVVAYHGTPNAIELAAEKFNAYLAEEGLQAVIALREARGESAAPGREIYSRCAKSLLRAGAADGVADGAADGAADRVLGLPLELVAERAPGRLRRGEALPVRLLHEGRPLAGALVVAIPRDAPRQRIALRSDAQGRVKLPLDRAGHWLVKAVHMRPAPPGSGADWESLWASLTFVGGVAAARR